MYTKEDFAPLITRHNLEEEAIYIAKVLNQDVWVIERILRQYWKDKLAVEWTIKDIQRCKDNVDIKANLSNDEALTILDNLSKGYSQTYGITLSDVEHSIEIHLDNLKL